VKNFKKLSAIAVLLCAFVYPSSIAEAKSTSLENSLQTSSLDAENNVVANEGELLLAQRDSYRRRYIRRPSVRRQYIRRQQRARRQYIRRQQRARRQYIRRVYNGRNWRRY